MKKQNFAQILRGLFSPKTLKNNCLKQNKFKKRIEYFDAIQYVKTIIFSLCLLGTLKIHAQIQRLDGSTIMANDISTNLQNLVQTHHITGLNVAIVHQNQVVYQQAFGVKDSRSNAPLSIQTVQYAASLTKPVFAFLFLQLVEKGLFELDKPIATYLKKPISDYPKFKDLAAEPHFPRITPRMILSHTSGLPVLRQLYGDSLYCLAEPTTKFYYSNEAYNLLGFVVEEWTGKTLEAWARVLIFDPLSMHNTGLVWQPNFETNYALGHDAAGKVIGAQKKTTARGAGSMVTTPTDYAQFLIAMMQGKGLGVSAQNWATMTTPQYFIKTKRGFGPARDSFSTEYANIRFAWSLGFATYQSAAGKVIFHAGHTDGWQNLAIAFPERGIAIVLMSNSDNFELVADKILAATIGETPVPLAWMGYFDK
jgi:CubicO group peptidase (beta-lactamase class C family)